MEGEDIDNENNEPGVVGQIFMSVGAALTVILCFFVIGGGLISIILHGLTQEAWDHWKEVTKLMSTMGAYLGVVSIILMIPASIIAPMYRDETTVKLAIVMAIVCAILGLISL